MNQSDQLYIDHEVRLQLLAEVAKDSKEGLKEIRKEISSSFKWTVTMFFTILLANIALFGSALLIKVT